MTRLRDQYDELQSQQRTLIENITEAEKPAGRVNETTRDPIVKKADAESALAKVQVLNRSKRSEYC